MKPIAVMVSADNTPRQGVLFITQLKDQGKNFICLSFRSSTLSDVMFNIDPAGVSRNTNWIFWVSLTIRVQLSKLMSSILKSSLGNDVWMEGSTWNSRAEEG
eukprot:Gb_09185 [translate_table: standard]